MPEHRDAENLPYGQVIRLGVLALYRLSYRSFDRAGLEPATSRVIVDNLAYSARKHIERSDKLFASGADRW